MAVIKSSALYGTGVYSGSVFGTRNVSFTLTGVAGTSTVQTVAINGFEIDISERLDSVSATGSVNTVTVNIQEDVTGVVGTFTLNGAGLSIRSINRVPVTQNALTGSIGTVKPKVDEALGSVSATGSVGTLTVHLSEKLASVSATGSIGSLEFSNTHSLTSTGITASIGTVRPNVKEELQLNAVSGVNATGSINTVTVHVKENLLSTSATGSIGFARSNVIAVQFDFEAVKTQYSRRRTVILPRVA